MFQADPQMSFAVEISAKIVNPEPRAVDFEQRIVSGGE
jgi:hypothetical protein